MVGGDNVGDEFAVTATKGGIEGTCGGCLSCATCHVIVDPDWYAKTGGPSEDEEDMLDLAFSLSETSRLGCQIAMTPELDGLRLTVPEDF